MEFQVGETEESDESGGFDLEEYIGNALSDKEVQMRIAQRAMENGVPPEIVKGFLPGNEISPGEILNAVEAQNQTEAEPTPELDKPGKAPDERELDTTESDEPKTKTPTMPETTTDDLDAEKVLDIIDDVISVHGEDMTLGELRDWADENRDLLENWI